MTGRTLGRRVVDTLGRDLVFDPGLFTLEASVGVLFFVGLALFVGNVFGVPASTSMTAVGTIATWWIVAPVIGFWVSLVVGRYFYSRLNRAIAMERSEGPLFELDRRGPVPVPVASATTNRRELAGVATVSAPPRERAERGVPDGDVQNGRKSSGGSARSTSASARTV